MPMSLLSLLSQKLASVPQHARLGLSMMLAETRSGSSPITVICNGAAVAAPAQELPTQHLTRQHLQGTGNCVLRRNDSGASHASAYDDGAPGAIDQPLALQRRNFYPCNPFV